MITNSYVVGSRLHDLVLKEKRFEIKLVRFYHFPQYFFKY